MGLPEAAGIACREARRPGRWAAGRAVQGTEAAQGRKGSSRRAERTTAGPCEAPGLLGVFQPAPGWVQHLQSSSLTPELGLCCFLGGLLSKRCTCYSSGVYLLGEVDWVGLAGHVALLPSPEQALPAVLQRKVLGVGVASSRCLSEARSVPGPFPTAPCTLPPGACRRHHASCRAGVSSGCRLAQPGPLRLALSRRQALRAWPVQVRASPAALAERLWSGRGWLRQEVDLQT